MNAVILAGGFGNRLKPLTDGVPKPMLNLCNVPMLDYTVSQLSYFGINDIVFTLGYMPEKIIEWTSGYKNISCHYAIESQPLGTCGGVKQASKYLDDTFVVLSGDGLSNIDLKKMHSAHKKSGADITIAVCSVKNPSLYGVVGLNESGYVTSFVEKPEGEYFGDFINCGVYIINKDILKFAPDGFFDFSKGLFPMLLGGGGRIAAYIHKGYWNDIGDVASYHQSNMDMIGNEFYRAAKNTNRRGVESYRVGSHASSLISKTANVSGVILSSVIGHNCIIDKNAVLTNCVVLDGTTVFGKHENSILCREFILDAGNYTLKEQKSQFSAQADNNIF